MQKKQYKVLHICDYSAHYRGNFIESLESMEQYHSNVKNFYLFPARAKETGAKAWIEAMNTEEERAYFQEASSVKTALLLRRILKEHKIDRVVRHFTDARIDILLHFLFPGKKVIRFFHNGYDPNDRSLKHWIRRFFWRGNRLVGVSDAVARDIQRAMPGFSVTSIVNAINFQRLDQGVAIAKPEGISLLMMGWDYKRKGVDLAIRACLKLRGRYDFVLRLVGLDSEASIRSLIREIAGEDASWIQFLPPTNQIGAYFRSNDIFLSPSRQEAFGYANVEAAYCENSVVLSRVDGQAELRLPGAYWFASENVDDLAARLDAAMADLGKPEKIAERRQTKAQVQKTYSLEEWCNKLVALFE